MTHNLNTAIKLIPASQFTIEQLTAIYNQTRVDYLVSMPMNSTRLAEYISMYDVDLDHSRIALLDNVLLGVAMQSVRDGRAWLTRLSVLPNT